MEYSSLFDCPETNGACGSIRQAQLELPLTTHQNLQVAVSKAQEAPFANLAV